MADQGPRLIKGLQAEYVPAFYKGRNGSGIKALGKNVVIQVDTCATASSGGIILTDDMVERMTLNSTTGCIVQIGAEAFRHFDDGTVWTGEKPEVGQRVYFEKYAGQIQRGIDGKDYRILDYRTLSGVVDMDNPDVAQAMADMEAEADEAEAQRAANETEPAPPPVLNRRQRRASAAAARA